MTEEIQKDTIKLISAEGDEFEIERTAAYASSTIKAMIESDFREGKENEIKFPDISAKILGKVIEYMKYKEKYKLSETIPPEFPLEKESCLELLMVANFLDC
eukprot:snap_masked-scaffold_7-processed-gene-6.22-mRNA-1 protein AED:0.07 eAED:0.07 QI:0/-1/0/1/-1/1/1/0/101